MKKLLLLLCLLLLTACNEKVIEVKHSNDFTSELIAQINLMDVNSNISYNFCDANTLCIHEYYLDDTPDYQINLNTNEVVKIDNEYNDEEDDNQVSFQFENVVFDNGYKIIIESIHEENVTTRNFYYEKDGIKTLLIQLTRDLSNYYETGFDFDYHSDGENFYIIIKENDEAVIYQVSNAMLKEIDRYPIHKDGYELTNIYMSSEGICFDYSNDETLRYVMNGEELVIPRNENGKELIEFEIDGLTPKRLVYKEDGFITLHLEDEVYELGYNAKYEFREQYILSSAWKEDFSGKETYYIDRNTKKTYLLSDFFELSNSFYYDRNVYLSNDLNGEIPYTIVKVDGLNITTYELPFSKDFQMIGLVGKGNMYFGYQNQDILEIYQVKF